MIIIWYNSPESLVSYRGYRVVTFWSYFLTINSHAVGKAVARPYGFKIDFARNLFSGSAAWFFVIILKFIFTPIFEIEIYEKIPWYQKKNSFLKADFLVAIFLSQKETDLKVTHFFRSLIKWRCAYWRKTSMATQRPYRQRRQYLTPTAWKLSYILE